MAGDGGSKRGVGLCVVPARPSASCCRLLSLLEIQKLPDRQRCRRCQERVHVRPATLPRRVRGPTWTTGGTKTRQQVTKFSLRPRPPASAPGGSQPLPTRGHLREPQPFAFNVLLAPRRPRPALSWGAVSGKGADGGRRAAGLGGERSRRRGGRLSAPGCHLGARLPGQSGTPPSGDRASGGSGLRPDGGGGGGPQAGQHGGRASQRDGGRGPHTSPLAPSLQELGLGSRRFLQIKKKETQTSPHLYYVFDHPRHSKTLYVTLIILVSKQFKCETLYFVCILLQEFFCPQIREGLYDIM